MGSDYQRGDVNRQTNPESSYARLPLCSAWFRVGPALVAFFGLSIGVWHRKGPSSFDTWLLHGFAPNRTTSAFRIADVVTLVAAPGVVVVLGFVIASLVWRLTKSVAWAAACVAAPGGAGVAESLMKVLVARPRPITAALTGESGNGFPSGHATGFAALVFVTALIFSQRWSRRVLMLALAAILAVIVAATRVIVGAHYPTDVVAGFLLGFAIAQFVSLVAGWVEDSPRFNLSANDLPLFRRFVPKSGNSS
jgi:membrane-associated phospholipid phosphatase